MTVNLGICVVSFVRIYPGNRTSIFCCCIYFIYFTLLSLHLDYFRLFYKSINFFYLFFHLFIYFMYIFILFIYILRV